MTGLKWTRRTAEKIAEQLAHTGIQVSGSTVRRLLKEMRVSLRVNRKTLGSGTATARDQQFVYINSVRQRFVEAGMPVVSVDAKKKELIGNFKNPGRTWARESWPVNDHDFRSLAQGIAIPYGVYDVEANRGFVVVGTSYDTPQFAVESIEEWWRCDGKTRYPKAKHLLILADGGGSNRSTSRLWLKGLQKTLCDRHGISVTVTHYPPGTSKWNPIEHRLFGEISKSWAGRPLDSYETVVKYISRTKTQTGLRVEARLVDKLYERGIKVPDEEMDRLCRTLHPTRPKLNYTMIPTNGSVPFPAELIPPAEDASESRPEHPDSHVQQPPLRSPTRRDSPSRPASEGNGSTHPARSLTSGRQILRLILELGQSALRSHPLGRNGTQHDHQATEPLSTSSSQL